MIIAEIGETNPAAGVMQTNPATAPEIAPIIVGLPCLSHSIIVQVSIAVAAAKCVVTKALVARALADNALPALKPNHPNHKSPAPIKLKTVLCGAVGSFL